MRRLLAVTLPAAPALGAPAAAVVLAGGAVRARRRRAAAPARAAG